MKWHPDHNRTYVPQGLVQAKRAKDGAGRWKIVRRDNPLIVLGWAVHITGQVKHYEWWEPFVLRDPQDDQGHQLGTRSSLGASEMAIIEWHERKAGI